MTDLVVAKFGGTSVADFDAMNRSIDVALLDANTRIVVLSASAGVTNILVALAGGLEPTERFSQLDALRQIQFNILERLRYPNVIREEIERLLENITTLAEAAALASSTALTDELVSHGELMSTLLFVEILRERGIQAQWFDARKVLRTNDRFGRAEPDIAAVAELTQQQLAPRGGRHGGDPGLYRQRSRPHHHPRPRRQRLYRRSARRSAECHPRRYLDRCPGDLYYRPARRAGGETHRRHRL